MIRAIDDFVTVWTQEAANTLTLFKGLSDSAMPQAVTSEHRDLGRLAWHITASIREMMERTGMHVDGPDEGAPVPASSSDIAREYHRSSESLIKGLGAWTDADLDIEHPMYGESWKRALILQVLLLHQTHHRGQMTVLMRQAGLPVAGMYGPSKDDWAKFGMPTPTI
ncbi:MAG: DinB family protein [Gemmatimonadota bacterium]|nr:DinB family protein [Gemmatimonadota bacterium]